MTFPELAFTPRIADPRCGSRDTPTAPTCNAPATWHIAWNLNVPKADFSLVCDQHMTAVQRKFTYVDRHPAAIACDMPGTGWLQGPPSRCVIATTDDVAAYAGQMEAQR